MNIHESTKKSSILAGDIGGTNCRLTLCDAAHEKPLVCKTEVLPSRSYNSLGEILEDFLRDEDTTIEAACFGVPGPVIDGEVSTTNLPWRISETSLKADTNCNKVLLLNDLSTAIAAMPHLEKSSLIELYPGKSPRNNNTIALIAPGTGLGQACMSSGKIFPSEGGHIEVSPRSEQEMRLLRFLWSYLRRPRASVERIVSGPGIANVYRFLVEIEKLPVLAETARRMTTEDPAAVIGELAVKGEDPTCIEAIKLFVRVLGSHAGNMALTYLCTGGIYIGGGIGPKILPFLQSQDFTNAFLDKGRLSPVVESTPLYIVKEPRAGLLGALHLAKELHETGDAAEVEESML